MSRTLLSRCARAAVTLALLLPVSPLPAQLPPLISRDILFGNPERAQPRVSPDGQRLAWLAPDKKNVLQVWVKTVGKDDDKMVTADKKRGIRQYFWAEDNRTLLYQQDNDGDENFHVFGVDLASGNVRDFTPFQGVRAGVADLNRDFPDEVVIKARDGLNLNSYLTLPVGVPPKNLPMVLFVHGGPWARDTWGYSSYAQWFANRGYAVHQPNYRGSTGYGKKFLYAGNRQWGLKMHDDLIDAAKWAVTQGYADPKKIAVFGGSYGGYAALAAATFTPDAFACNVDIVGPSNLKTLIASIPPYWKPLRATFDVRMGNVDDPKDAELIKKASPLFKADKIVRPLLIGQGANDPRVNVKESEQIVDAIEKSKGNVTYVVYSDEGHGFARPENRIDFNAPSEKFLAGCPAGRFEPMEGDKIPGSTAVVKVVGK